MGATPHAEGVTFRVWAPHAERVAVVGSFNDWNAEADPLLAEGGGIWSGDVAGARRGDEYRFHLDTQAGALSRIDPYARRLTSSVGNAVVHDPAFDWEHDTFRAGPRHEAILYELHVGTFHTTADGDGSGTLDAAARRLEHLRDLGVTAIALMPVASFAGDRSWGYNPSHPFAVANGYGGPDALKRFVLRAHQLGLAVLVDAVYNHFGPGDLSLWQFDGWSEEGRGGIYFYNDDRAATPWGDTRPDYGRGEVRQYLLDNALMWFEEFHVDGIRLDCTAWIRTIDGSRERELADGWSLLRWITGQVRARFPRALIIAEDLLGDPSLTRSVADGGAGFDAQWDAGFVHAVRHAMTAVDDHDRSLAALREGMHPAGPDPFDRVIYVESHDDVANGAGRFPRMVRPDDPDGWHARKRSALASTLLLTTPGIPMLLQGQEFLEHRGFHDTLPLDWGLRETHAGILRLHHDLIALHRNRQGRSRGLTGAHLHVHHLDEERKVIAYHRWERGGPGDDVVVVANLSAETYLEHVIGMPAEGRWGLTFNSDWRGYGADFGDHPSTDLLAASDPRDGMPASATVLLGPYSALIYVR